MFTKKKLLSIPLKHFHSCYEYTLYEYIFISEADTISERDFACPAKRRKQDENDDEVILRKPAFNDDYKYRIDLLDQTNTDAFAKR